MSFLFLSAAHADAPLRLADAAVVDRDAGLAWVSLPGGAVAGIDLATGARKVTTQAHGRPLALHDGELLVITEQEKGRGRLPLVVLDATGKQTGRCGTLALPEWAGGLHTGNGWAFSTVAWWSGGTFVVRWAADTYYVGGAQPTEDMLHPNTASGLWACVGGAVDQAAGDNAVAGLQSYGSPGSTFHHVGDRVMALAPGEREGIVFREWKETGGDPIFERALGVPYGWSSLSADGKEALILPDQTSGVARIVDVRTGENTGRKVPVQAAWGVSVGKRWIGVANVPYNPELQAYGADGALIWTVPLEAYESFPIPYP